jgi:hypothetical protein
MKKKKIKTGIFIALLLTVFTCSAFAYTLNPTRPTTKNLSFYTNDLTSAERTAALDAAFTWSGVTNGISFGTLGDRTGDIDFFDSRSDVGVVHFTTLTLIYNIQNSYTGYCWVDQNNNYNKFDVILNSNMNWGNGNSESYLDRQGNFTHEFGHAAGLYHNSSIPGNTSPDKASLSDYQTMYPSVYDPLGRNLTFYWRTLTGDDISGVQYVASKI